MDIQKMVDAISESSRRERSNYHATFGDLIDKLKNADESSRLDPKIVGLGAYRGYYSDIALFTESDGIYSYEDEAREDGSLKDFPQEPKKLALALESLIGFYLDGYKGGMNEITRDKPLWVASDYGDCSQTAVVDITDDLKLILKQVE